MIKRLISTSIFTGLVAIAFLPSVALAGEVYNRQVRQEQRINQGVKNGSISAQEYNKLQKREIALNAARLRDIRDGNGFTAHEKYKLNQRASRISNSIYTYKHN
jgi:hypothetical protein